MGLHPVESKIQASGEGVHPIESKIQAGGGDGGGTPFRVKDIGCCGGCAL